MEDRKNSPRDINKGEVRAIIFIEDSPRFYSVILPLIYQEIMYHTQQLVNKSFNHTHRLLHLRSRTKILFATQFEEAKKYFNAYHKNILGIVSDIRFPRKGILDPDAGIHFTQYVRKKEPHIPVVLQSTNLKKKKWADKVNASFLNKRSDSLLYDIRNFITNNFGFGNFIFRSLDGAEIAVAADLKELRNHYFVGYNLRFHPLINKLKEDISTEEIFSVDVVCNSYLPDWRNNIPYEDSSSASKARGGGVLLDLSHEIDYINYIFGDISHLFSENIKLSKLDIDTDDYLSLIGKIKKGGLFTLNMKYFSFNEIRRLSIETNLRSIVLDILNSKITYFSGDKVEKIESDYLFNSTYLDQHKAILDNDFSKICSLDEGMKVMEMIDSVQKVRER